MSCTYTSSGAAPAADTPTPVVEATPDVQEPGMEEEEVIAVESISIEPKLIFLKVGATRQIHVKVKPPGADAGDVTVKQFDSGIVSISEGPR